MPKTNMGKPPLLRETEEMLKDYPMYLRACDIGRIIGMRDYPCIYEFLEGLQCYTIGRTKKWRRDDVARRIYESVNT